MRWDPYILAIGEGGVQKFWKHRGAEQRRALLVAGRGFDPRATHIPKLLKNVGVGADVRLVVFGPESFGDQNEARGNSSAEEIEQLFAGRMIAEMNVVIGGRATSGTSKNTRAAVLGLSDWVSYQDVVVDITAMPRMVGLTMVSQLLYDFDGHEKLSGESVNLFVTTSESASIDATISWSALREDISMLHGFSGGLSAESSEGQPRVWFPILGEGQELRLRAIQEKLDPDEICPIIPFPSRNVRRGDDIIYEHRSILFDEFQIEPRNILLASEYNPFEAYKQIYKAIERYFVALREIGGCKAFVSPLSSKLLSIAGLLACYDHKFGGLNSDILSIGIPYVESETYSDLSTEGNVETVLYSMWMRGDWEK